MRTGGSRTPLRKFSPYCERLSGQSLNVREDYITTIRAGGGRGEMLAAGGLGTNVPSREVRSSPPSPVIALFCDTMMDGGI
jgi:hypothetical protein